MPELDEREIKHHSVCCTCKHYVAASVCIGYCLLDLSQEEKLDYRWKLINYSSREEFDEDFYDCEREVTPDCSCQFHEE